MPNETNGANVEFISQAAGGLSASGSVAARLLESNFNINALRPLGTLRKDEWVLFDREVVEVAQVILNGVQDLMTAGLTMPVPNALGVMQIQWERMSDMSDAQVNMSPVVDSLDDRVEFDLASMPLPIIHKDFTMNIRALQASRNGGMPLDTVQVRLATRKVSEKIERILWSGTTALGTNSPIYGYTTQPQRTTGSVTANWLTATGDQIIKDAIAMIDDAVANKMYGPYTLYVPMNVLNHFNDDYKAASDKAILTRLKEIPQISAIKGTFFLTGTNVILVQLTRDVVELVEGFGPTMLQWDTHGGLIMNFKIMAIMVPRFRNDMDENSGIVHYS